jgi:hypothetical protein
LKKYIKPQVEITKLTAQDVLATSTQLDEDFIE